MSNILIGNFRPDQGPARDRVAPESRVDIDRPGEQVLRKPSGNAPPPSSSESARKPARPRRQPVITTLIAVTLILQICGTLEWIRWTPGLFVGGGIDRIVDFARDQGFEAAAHYVKLATDVTTCAYWAVMLVASSGLGADAPPRLMPGERGWRFSQRRAAYLPPLLLLLSCHLAGALIASTGWWVLALPFELGGHFGMAALLYISLIPEGRRQLVIIEDVEGRGLASRMHVSSGFYSKGRRWLAIRHDHLRGAELLDPLWARLCNTAHLELTYLDNNNRLCAQVVKGIGSKDDLASIVSILNGRFRQGRPLLFTLPPSYANGPQRPMHVDEETPPF